MEQGGGKQGGGYFVWVGMIEDLVIWGQRRLW